MSETTHPCEHRCIGYYRLPGEAQEGPLTQICDVCRKTVVEIEEAAYRRGVYAGKVEAAFEAKASNALCDPPPNRVQQAFYDQNERQAAQYRDDMRRAMLLNAAALLESTSRRSHPVLRAYELLAEIEAGEKKGLA